VTDGCEASRHSLGSPNPTQSRKGTERKGKDRTGRSKRDWFLHFPYTLENLRPQTKGLVSFGNILLNVTKI